MRWRQPVTAALLGLALSGSLQSREPDDLEAISRELSIAGDVFRSSMKNSLPDGIRVSGVKAQYLARQGVLVSMNVTLPWVDMDAFAERSEALGSGVDSVSDVPELVHEILAELNAAFSGYPPEEMAVLTELRSEQREVRRELRSLRSTARALRRSDDPDRDEQLAALEQEATRLNGDLEALDEELAREQARIDELMKDPERMLPVAEVDAAVTSTACNYGATFKSLGGDQYLTVAVNTRESVRYYVFRMELVNECRRGNLSEARLLERSIQYVL